MSASIDTGRFGITPQQWCAWQWLSPELDAPWACSPFFPTSVEALKTGQHKLRVEGVCAIARGGARQIGLEMTVLSRTPKVLLGRCEQGAGDEQNVLFAPITFRWLDQCCHEYRERCPGSRVPQWFSDEPPPSVDAYLAENFGRSPSEIVTGATQSSFQGTLWPMPKKRRTVELQWELRDFEAYLIGRGYVPREMEDKWFVYREMSRIWFRRSWTGIPIYRIDIEDRASPARIARVVINDNPVQYKPDGDDASDLQLLRTLIEELLLRRPIASLSGL